MNPQILPKTSAVDVSALSRLFTERTTSYKFLFFYALINKIQADNNKILLQELGNDMLALAWYPYKFFNLSFGMQDQTATILDKLDFSLEGKKAGTSAGENALRSALVEQQDDIDSKKLLRYVPYRLLKVFFEPELRGKADQRKNSLITRLSEEFFDDKKPFYRIYESDGHIYLEFHPSWRRYFTENFTIITGWFYWEWLKFLQTRNPSIPSISNKIFSPQIRSPLTDQKRYWNEIISQDKFYCIFSEKLLNGKDCALDHFIPWSFVCHDQLWNLIPVKIFANSSKKNHVPDVAYLNRFIEMQVRGLFLARDVFPERSWRKMTRPFVEDMQLGYEELLDANKVANAYHHIMSPLMSLAGNSGFQTNWRY